MILAFILAVGAFGMLAGAISYIVKGRVGTGIIVGVMALLVGSGAASLAAYA
jgi:hypothetical protein